MSKHRPLPIDNGGTGKSKDFTLPLSIGLAASILFTTAANVNSTLKVSKIANEIAMEQAVRKNHDLVLLKLAQLNHQDALVDGSAISGLAVRVENLVYTIDKQKKQLEKQDREIKELIRVAPSTYSLK